MSWKEITIDSFLKERPDIIKPDQANSLNLKRIEKIDFSGNIFLADKTQTRTNMIIVKSGDLVISGINAEKGALAVYEGEEDVLATIHYSSYEFDTSIVDIEYFKWFLTSNVFMNILKEQVGGGIKTELKPKKFLPIKIKLPGIDLQRKIAKKINNVSKEIRTLKETTEENYELISKLRQSILQEAVQGKLVPQDLNDEPASVLLEKIKEEKERLIKEKKIKKQKPLPPITEDEIPYELPKGWEWVRLGEITNYAFNESLKPEEIDSEEWVLELEDIEKDTSRLVQMITNKDRQSKSNKNRFYKGDVLYGKLRPYLKKVLVAHKDGVCSTEIIPFKGYCNIDSKYIMCYMKSPYTDEIVNSITHGMSMPRLGTKNALQLLFPLPPLNEQKLIVQKVYQLMALCDELAKNIEQSKKDSDLLLQSVLQKAFKEA